MNCNNCGNKVKSGDKFCSYCGNEVKDEVINDSNSSNDYSGVIFGIIAIFTIALPLICIPCAVVAMIKGKKNKNVSFILGILSMILSILFTLIIILFLFVFFNFVSDGGYSDKFIEKADKYIDKFDDFDKFFDNKKEDIIDNFDIKNHIWNGNGNSRLILKDDDKYIWYSDFSNDGTYTLGDYNVYSGMDAFNYFMKHFGKNEDILDKYDIHDNMFSSNFYFVVLNCKKEAVNGDVKDVDNSSFYLAIYNGDELSLYDVLKNDEFVFSLDSNDGVHDGTI